MFSAKAQYRHQENPAEYIYESLRSRLKIVQLPSPKAPPTKLEPRLRSSDMGRPDKQPPSALEYVGQFQRAIELMKVKTREVFPFLSLSPLGACIADFNKTTVQRKYKIDTCKWKVLTNLMRAPRGFSDLLAGHYDKHKRSSSGAP